MSKRTIIAAAAAACAVAGLALSSSAVAQSTAAVEPITVTECVQVFNSSGIAELCVEISRNEQGYFAEKADVRTDSTVLSTVELRVRHDGGNWGFQREWGFRHVRTSLSVYETPSSSEACAVGGVGIDSKDYNDVCVKLP